VVASLGQAQVPATVRPSGSVSGTETITPRPTCEPHEVEEVGQQSPAEALPAAASGHPDLRDAVAADGHPAPIPKP